MIFLLLVYLLLPLPWSPSLDQFGSFGETKAARLFEHKQMKRTNTERYHPPLSGEKP